MSRWNQTIAERFWSKVERRGPADCWPWLASKQGEYGQFYLKGRPIKASRACWYVEHRRMPKLHVLHTCDNPICVNPKHLYLGTPAQNTADKITRDRQPHGVRHYKAKLTPGVVRSIRRLWNTDRYMQHEIATKLDIELWNVKSVLQEKSWVRVK